MTTIYELKNGCYYPLVEFEDKNEAENFLNALNSISDEPRFFIK